MSNSSQSTNKGHQDLSGTSNTAPRKVFRSKMTDAYAMDELGEERSAKEPEEYFEDISIHILSEINLIFEKIVNYYFTPFGLTHIQIPILLTLLREGSMTVSQLGRSLEIGSSNITPLCKRLESMQLVTRTRDQYDQRVVFITITEHAKDLLMEINRSIRNKTKDAVTPLSPSEQEQVQRGMALFRDYLADVIDATDRRDQANIVQDKRRSRMEAAKLATELSESKRRKRKSRLSSEDQVEAEQSDNT